MEDQIQHLLDHAKADNDKTIAHLISELEKVRAGKATPSMLDSVHVEYYGSMTPIHQLANINTMDARTITVQPWERGILDAISKGIIDANLGLNPQNNGDMIILNVPALTEERRKDLVKKVKAEAEHAKVGIRNNRKEAMDQLKKLKNDGLPEDRMKDLETKIQTLTDTAVKRCDEVADKKEKDIMTV